MKKQQENVQIKKNIEKYNFDMNLEKEEAFLRIIILILIYIIAFITRLYSVLRYESVIHEFDPYFNFRTTKVLVNEGFYNFLNWFDVQSWYPLGRIVGGTVYPGLMLTAGLIHYILNFFHITIDIRNVCVLLAPLFASNTALATYFITKEVKGKGAGLFAAAMIAIVPAYISRSVAGSYDNEGIAIFALIFTFGLWIKAVKTGSIFWSIMCTLSYFYMVSAWGGYVFIINLIPLYVFIMLISGRYSYKIYIAYSIFYIVGTLLTMQINFVGFQAITSSEHFSSLIIFCLLQIHGFLTWIRTFISNENFQKFLILSIIIFTFLLIISFMIGYGRKFISPWTGRFYSMFDPTYAKDNIPIIASVAEHQPTIWTSFFFDLHFLILLFPVGLYFCFKNLTDESLFIICYAVTSVYFTGVMVRLMLVFAPVVCILSGIALSSILEFYIGSGESMKKKFVVKEGKIYYPIQKDLSKIVSFGILLILCWYVYHCTWITSEAYSSPSIVLAARQQDGSQVIFDDFRGAYRWLNYNTPPDARIMSWWDYGYQITAMANRTVLVDNNTWNNTHIATVGKAMASTEEVAYPIMLSLDVDYVLVIFGGVIGYASDDINKFLWMVRIGGGVYPEIKEIDYFNSRGEYRVDVGGSKVFLRSLMYKLSYYRFGELRIDLSTPPGFDRVRGVEIGNKKIKLKYLEEVYTSEHWLVRIYKVKKLHNRH